MKKYQTYIIISASIIFIIIAVKYTLLDRNIVTPPQTIDLTAHPIYSKYQFEIKDNIINIGAQPLSMPTEIISEAMKRDTILIQSLKNIGMEIRFYSFLKGADVNYFVKKGYLSVGFCGDMPAIMMSSNSDIVIAAMTHIGYTSILAKQPTFIPELKGKRLGCAFGSNAHYGLMATLAQQGLSERDVTLMQMDISEMPQALKTDKVDAISIWDPMASMIIMDNPNTLIIHKMLSTQYLYFTKRLYDNQQDAVDLILASEIRAINWFLLNRENRIKAASWVFKSASSLSAFSLTNDMIVEMGQKRLKDLTSTPFIPDNIIITNGPIYKEFLFLKKIGLLPKDADWDKVHNSFTNDALLDVLGSPQTYRLNTFQYRSDDNE
jgi:hypothetical protein